MTLLSRAVQNGNTALICAISEGHASIVTLLLDAKVDVNLRNKVSDSLL